ncbi:MAG: flagellar hook-associated protein FlgK [Campylobacterales bacterium]|nr:flagellar hook-associated protein FlgK [Campylobacterales bacterium]
MASIFNALHIGYSGLNAAQVGINVTGHNIANAETEGYTRQRVVTQASRPSSLTTGISGNGVSITEIARVFDHYVYDRYVSVSESKTNSDFKRNTLETLSSYFPEIDGVGIKADLNRYFDLWQSFADNPDNEAMKIALAQQTQTLSQNIFQTREKVVTQQSTLDEQMVTLVDEVNKIAKEIAALNVSINEIESTSTDNANDLRDRRNLLEKSMADLIGADSFEGLIETNTPVDPNIAIKSGSYSLHVAGFNIVDGGSFHPIGVTTVSDAGGFHDLYYERQDGVQIPFEQSIKGGKIGAILELRGTDRNTLTGEAENGILHDTVKMLDSFATGLIEHTNNIYAGSATASMRSDQQGFDQTVPLRNSGLNINNGSFDLKVYDNSGMVVAVRSITIDSSTAFGDALTPGSIIGQIAALADDNQDGSGINDIDDLIHAEFNGGYFSLSLQDDLAAQGYRFSIVDEGSNFAGALGMHRFFEGNDARTIGLDYTLATDTSKISAAAVPVAGDNQIATQMVDMQFQDITFYSDGGTMNDSVYGFFDSIVTSVGTKTNAEIIRNDALLAQFNSITMEYESVSKVSLDEELTNLIRYQTSYGAAAKVISTVDQMMTTLLGIKQ